MKGMGLDITSLDSVLEQTGSELKERSDAQIELLREIRNSERDFFESSLWEDLSQIVQTDKLKSDDNPEKDWNWTSVLSNGINSLSDLVSNTINISNSTKQNEKVMAASPVSPVSPKDMRAEDASSRAGFLKGIGDLLKKNKDKTSSADKKSSWEGPELYVDLKKYFKDSLSSIKDSLSPVTSLASGVKSLAAGVASVFSKKKDREDVKDQNRLRDVLDTNSSAGNAVAVNPNQSGDSAFATSSITSMASGIASISGILTGISKILASASVLLNPATLTLVLGGAIAMGITPLTAALGVGIYFVVSTIGDLLTRLIDEVLAPIADVVVDALGPVLTSVGGLVDSVSGAIGDLASSVLSLPTTIIDGIASAIKASASAITSSLGVLGDFLSNMKLSIKLGSLVDIFFGADKKSSVSGTSEGEDPMTLLNATASKILEVLSGQSSTESPEPERSIAADVISGASRGLEPERSIAADVVASTESREPERSIAADVISGASRGLEPVGSPETQSAESSVVPRDLAQTREELIGLSTNGIDRIEMTEAIKAAVEPMMDQHSEAWDSFIDALREEGIATRSLIAEALDMQSSKGAVVYAEELEENVDQKIIECINNIYESLSALVEENLKTNPILQEMLLALNSLVDKENSGKSWFGQISSFVGL